MQQISLENEDISSTLRQVILTIPTEIIDKVFNQKIKEIASKIKLDGFRPGKVPLSIVKKQYGDKAFDESKHESFVKEFTKYLNDNKIDYIHNSVVIEDITDKEIDNKPHIKFTIKFEVYPEIKFAPFNALKPTKMIVDISEQDIDDSIANLCKINSEDKYLQQPAEKDHIVSIKYSVTDKQGNIVANLAEDLAQNIVLSVTQTGILNQIKPYILGMKPSDTKTVSHDFPEDFYLSEVAGKNFNINIELLNLYKKVVAELNSEFIKKIGIQSGNEEDLRKEIKANLQHQAKKIVDARLTREITDNLIEANKISEVPNVLVNDIVTRIESSLKKVNLNHDVNNAQNKENKENKTFIEGTATEMVTRNILIRALIKKYEIVVDQKSLSQYINEMLRFAEDPQSTLKSIVNNEEHLASIRNELLNDMAVKKVIAESNIQEKLCSFSEVLEYYKKNMQ